MRHYLLLMVLPLLVGCTFIRARVWPPAPMRAVGLYPAELAASGLEDPLYDVNGDGVVTAADSWYAWDALRSQNLRADFDGDKDVDQSDFGMLQARLGDWAMPNNVFDLNSSGVVDQGDVDLFYAWMTGPNQGAPQ